MSLPFINLRTQYDELKKEINLRIDAVLEHGQYIMGPEVVELEAELAKFCGAKHCITCASGTEALLMSLMTLGIGPGDEVITTPFTFAATVEVIVLLGARPVFVDVEGDTGNIDANLIAAAITNRTKAILPVSLYGQVADMAAINKIAEDFEGIPVIEDAAQSFGAKYFGEKSCNLSTLACTSFFPSKPLGCYGDGGAIFTNSDEYAKILREIRVHGQSERYVHSRVGVGGRMDTIQCAIVLAKLTRFEWELERRRNIGETYNKLFDRLGIERILQRSERQSVFAQYTILVEHREQLQAFLKDRGVPTAVHYPIPLNEQPAYRHLCCEECTPNAKRLSRLVLSLPMGPDLSNESQDYIINSVNQYLQDAN